MDSDCLNKGATCQWISDASAYECACPFDTFFSLVNNTCVPFKKLNEICTDSSECFLNASCLFQASSSDRRCSCAPSKYYSSGNSLCLFLKSYNQTCRLSSECNWIQGLTCRDSVCQCDIYSFYNSNSRCEPRLTTNSNSYSKYCTSENECQLAFGLKNCVTGLCKCESPATWNGTHCA